jgi:hypothetical protein
MHRPINIKFAVIASKNLGTKVRRQKYDFAHSWWLKEKTKKEGVGKLAT